MNTNSTIQAIFSDIDGTLLTSAKTISPSTYHAISHACNNGTSFVLASARCPTSFITADNDQDGIALALKQLDL
ncbi:HAD family hydrolase [[Ruminococcus] lactaris]|jgi:predicted mannosyl-3-phosphoglycerate phosphatase (HAD superfamily)|uniref:Uncharacterized protein n=1 Tax=[Ruminococcus] lactaris TaxID=46228 RepID=A0A414P477_9FIRM|nr:HAD hydrolase family protein [[Ruminococcus] lactaris]RHF60072.1 hypothetical protein DW672_08000 [[Ruminococcus] lactaris]